MTDDDDDSLFYGGYLLLYTVALFCLLFVDGFRLLVRVMRDEIRE